MFSGTGFCFPELSSNGKNMPDQDAGEISAQSNLHPTQKSWEAEEGWGRPAKKADSKGLDSSEHYLLSPQQGDRQLLLKHALPRSLLE